MKRSSLNDAAQVLADAERVLLTCHRGPDGDSIGSMIALACLLREQGAEAVLYCPDPVPRNLKWMPHAKSFVRRLKAEQSFPLTVVVDCGDPALLGKDFPGPETTGTLLALDHHGSGVPFGDLFVCDPAAASVGVLVWRLAKRLRWKVSREAATALWVSLVADTGQFRYSNTNVEALELAAHLVQAGVNPGELTERMALGSTMARYRLLSLALASIETAANDKVALMTITNDDVAGAKASWEDTEGFVNYVRGLRGAECGVLFTPSKYGGIRVSMRSKGAIDVGAICKLLGGGGHRGAAGCNVAGSLEEVRKQVVERLDAAFNTAPNTPEEEQER